MKNDVVKLKAEVIKQTSRPPYDFGKSQRL